MRRLMLAFAGALALLADDAGPAAASATPSCVTAAEAAYRHSFDGGAGQATVTAVRPLCSGQSQEFALLSYSTSSSAYPQFVYDEARATIDARHRDARLAVTVPACYFRVDLILGTDVRTEVVDRDSDYGNLVLGVPHGTGSRSTGRYGSDTGGTSPCTPKPVITYHNACDGTFTATLADDASANVDAVFLIAGHRLRVAPGHSAGAQRHTGTLTIRDNTFTTNIGTWEKPPTGCDPATPSAGPASAPPDPGASPPSPATAATSDPPDASVADPLDAAGTAQPDVTTSPSRPPAALRAAGMSLSSAAWIALGVLLIAAGLLVLFRVLRTIRRT